MTIRGQRGTFRQRDLSTVGVQHMVVPPLPPGYDLPSAGGGAVAQELPGLGSHRQSAISCGRTFAPGREGLLAKGVFPAGKSALWGERRRGIQSKHLATQSSTHIAVESHDRTTASSVIRRSCKGCPHAFVGVSLGLCLFLVCYHAHHDQ